ncbi:MAG: thioredoxin family protein [Chlorobiaceae bacterium]|nr:thioredoxin family protein [Chlorobiaceae bacterium]
MMHIKILGALSAESTRLADMVNSVIASAGVEAVVEKIEDYREIVRYGVMSMPALILDGKVLCRGRVPSLEEICMFLKVNLPRKFFDPPAIKAASEEEVFAAEVRPFSRAIRK